MRIYDNIWQYDSRCCNLARFAILWQSQFWKKSDSFIILSYLTLYYTTVLFSCCQLSEWCFLFTIFHWMKPNGDLPWEEIRTEWRLEYENNGFGVYKSAAGQPIINVMTFHQRADPKTYISYNNSVCVSVSVLALINISSSAHLFFRRQSFSVCISLESRNSPSGISPDVSCWFQWLCVKLRWTETGCWFRVIFQREGRRAEAEGGQGGPDSSSWFQVVKFSLILPKEKHTQKNLLPNFGHFASQFGFFGFVL